jgi:cysteine-S-conjugate beta-lyase
MHGHVLRWPRPSSKPGQIKDTGYPWASPLVAAFADFAQARWGWPVDPDRATVVPDTMIGIESLLPVATPPEAAVVLSPPCYDSFYGFVAAAGRRLLLAPLGADLRLDFDALAAAFGRAGRGSVIDEAIRRVRAACN